MEQIDDAFGPVRARRPGVAETARLWRVCPARATCRAAIALLLAAAACPANEGDFAAQRRADALAEYALLGKAIADFKPGSEAQARLGREALRADALILPADRTPFDVVMRRTLALAAHIESMRGAPDLSAEGAALDDLAARAPSATSEEERQALFLRLCELRRGIALRNPLLDFDEIVFLKHHKQGRGEIHMIDQYFGFNARAGGGVFILEGAFGDSPSARDALGGAVVGNGRLKGRRLEGGSFVSLDLDYDAESIAFAWTEAAWEVPADADWSTQSWTLEECRMRPDTRDDHYFWRPEGCYHVFRADLRRPGRLRALLGARRGASGLLQLTDGRYNEFDPCFLPNGRIAFISERLLSCVRCGMRWCPSANLHAMMRDGSDIIPLSYHETNEWHPSVNNDGMIVYTRWDYVDRDNDAAHHMWVCYPDGRDPRAPHGNYTERRETRPWMELAVRAIPNSRKYVATAAPHHGENYGSLILIDPRQPDDGGMRQIRRITPDALFPEAEAAPGVPLDKGRHNPKGEVYGTPWPLDEDFHLCVYDPDQKNYGIYLADSFGNKVLLYRDAEIPCLDPIPLRARRRPPAIPIATRQAIADRKPGDDLTATVAVMNVYDSERPFPAGEKVAALRVIQVFPKDNAFKDVPYIGHAAESLARGVLGTAPVEADGSAHFEVPTGVEIYFQALDERGRAIQTMRSGTYAHAGERLTCVGCHESKRNAAMPSAAAAPLALRKPPAKLLPGPEGSYPITFARLVQPVLDRHCVGCHGGQQPKAPDFRATLAEPDAKRKPKRIEEMFGVTHLNNGWTSSYLALRDHSWGMAGGNGIIFQQPQVSIPGQIGARASRLMARLGQGPCGAKLPDEDLARIALWLDCNSIFYGAYHEAARQARGEIVPPKLGYLQPFAR